MTLSLVLFTSHEADNLQAIYTRIENGELDASIELVITNYPGSEVIEKTKEYRINTTVIPHHQIDREGHELRIKETLEKYDFDLIVLSNYDQELSKSFIDDISCSILNVHPSLLPSFNVDDPITEALEFGVKVTGCTIHAVNSQERNIVAQACVPVYDDDTEQLLAERIIEKECKLYPQILQKISKEKIVLG